ncbi:hypothetical protein SAMN04487782_0063 [Stenotrophomonas maltophilia]|nr:hypothetical protein SAMN04487782_0063 [Stenotrophomonas maltophilia]
MALISAPPSSLTDVERPRNTSVREQLQQLEEVAHEEIRELQQLADARPSSPGTASELLGMAWDLGLDGDALR